MSLQDRTSERKKESSSAPQTVTTTLSNRREKPCSTRCRSLGFECLGIYPNGEDRCTFLRLNNLTLEVWTMDPTPMENGAINHFALDSTDIEASFAEAQKLGLNFAEGSIQHIDTFWSNGIRYFNVLGPNHEVIEFCQIM